MRWDFLLEAFWRSTVLLIGGEALLRLCKRQSAAFRHRLLLSAFALLAVLPVLCAVFPPIFVSISNATPVGRAQVTVHQISSEAVTAQSAHKIAWPMVIWLLGF